jgi:hypothetical protein
MNMWIKVVGLVLVVGAASLAVALAWGARRWRIAADSLDSRVAGRPGAGPLFRFDATEVEGLPGPVVRYFRLVLQDGQPLVARARIQWQGEFRMSEAEDSWRPFSARQVFSAERPEFVWNARIRMAPAVSVYVRDAYLDGTGSMRAEIAGLIPVLNAPDSPELRAGALQRYLAEAVWFPTALLPSQGVEWSGVDDSTAAATLSDGPVQVSVDFHFGPGGGIIRAHTPERFREVNGAYVPTPWSGRYGSYSEREGIRIPLEAEVRWHLSDGDLPYWRARVTGVEYTPQRRADPRPLE